MSVPWLRVFVSVLASSAVAMAQAPPVAQPPEAPALPRPRALTLGEALAYARAHQPSIVAARARIEAAVADAGVPRSQWAPNVGVTAQLLGGTASNTTASYLSSPVVDIPRIGGTRAASSARAWTPYASSFVGVGVGQELFDFGRIAAQTAAADALVEVERERAQRTDLDLVLAVRESFCAVHAARSVLAAADAALTRTRAHRELARAGVESGLRPPIELTRAEADLGRFRLAKLRAENGLLVAQTVFAATVGVEDAALDAAGELPADEDTVPLADALARGTERDPLVRETIARARFEHERTQAIRAEARPDLSLSATLSGRAGGATPSSGDVPTGNGFVPYVPNWDVGVVLTWPLYDATVNARADASRAREGAARALVDVARKEQTAIVQRAYLAVRVARVALPALTGALEAAIANQVQADARFQKGLATAIEVADAEGLRTEAEIQLALGRFEVARARARLSRAIAEGS